MYVLVTSLGLTPGTGCLKSLLSLYTHDNCAMGPYYTATSLGIGCEDERRAWWEDQVGEAGVQERWLWGSRDAQSYWVAVGQKPGGSEGVQQKRLCEEGNGRKAMVIRMCLEENMGSGGDKYQKGDEEKRGQGELELVHQLPIAVDRLRQQESRGKEYYTSGYVQVPTVYPYEYAYGIGYFYGYESPSFTHP